MTSQTLLQANLPKGMDSQIADFEHELLMGGLFGPFRKWWYGRKAYTQNRDHIFKMIGELLDEREKNPPTRPDAIKLMTEDLEPGEVPPTRQELIYDVAMLFLAGSDSTSGVILWGLMFLYDNPEWLAELREELKAWKPDQFTSMGDFPKLKATIMEMERLRPPFPIMTRVPLMDVEYKGMTIPKGTSILHIISLPHFLEEVYPDPHTFNPRRFLQEPAAPPKAHGIFGGGTHVCLGQPLARVQEPLAIANIVQNYDIEFGFKPSLQAVFSAVVTPAEKEMPVRFVRRNV
jgi:cytochrome P450